MGESAATKLLRSQQFVWPPPRDFRYCENIAPAFDLPREPSSRLAIRAKYTHSVRYFAGWESRTPDICLENKYFTAKLIPLTKTVTKKPNKTKHRKTPCLLSPMAKTVGSFSKALFGYWAGCSLSFLWRHSRLWCIFCHIYLPF